MTRLFVEQPMAKPGLLKIVEFQNLSGLEVLLVCLKVAGKSADSETIFGMA